VNVPPKNVDVPPKKVEESLYKLIEQFQEQELKLEQLYSQLQQQQELLNEVLREIKKDPLLPQSSKSPFSILEKFKLDPEKLAQIVTFIGALYFNNSDEDLDQEQNQVD
jgi:hypothetical protein